MHHRLDNIFLVVKPFFSVNEDNRKLSHSFEKLSQSEKISLNTTNLNKFRKGIITCFDLNSTRFIRSELFTQDIIFILYHTAFVFNIFY